MLIGALALSSSITSLIVVLAVVVVLLAIFFMLVPVGTWFRALVSGARISMGRLIGMRLRRINYRMIVEAYINATKAGLDIDIVELETHCMAGGDVLKVVNALISAHSANIELSLRTAKAIDLAGRDVLNAVKVSVNPKVIETPAIAAIAKNGIELRVKARVT
ncbi:MAG: flotillin-like FloA family protein, partial [Eubacteriales bacterium]|nr:flotillin-like FloA family protein [Eubacteriales bacterium]